MKHIQSTRFILSKIAEHHDIDDVAIDRLVEAIQPIIVEHGFSLSPYETISLGLRKFSIGDCTQCGAMCVDRDTNSAGLPEDYIYDNMDFVILNGGRLNDDLLCESCLPSSHRWGHHS